MTKMNLYTENISRSISYFYSGGGGRLKKLVGNNRDKIVSEVIGRIILSNRNKEASPGEEVGAVM
jgi:hypothetical protein